ncbi:MAG: hypothetical protein JSR42_17240 [Proteobacteria bacterium]|nr:hypothetical protein [Pseudomonadota bacterium]
MNDIAPIPDNPTILREWLAFSERLATVLSALQEDQFLVISVKQTNRYIQFAAQGSDGMRAEVSSNAFLSSSERLSEGQMARLTHAGWLPPTGRPEASTPEHDPDGSSNFFKQYPVPINSRQIAEEAVAALAHILRVPHPGFLEYDAFDDADNALALAELGIKCASAEAPSDLPKIGRRLLAITKDVTAIQDLDYDEDGDIGIRFGSTAIFVRLVGDPAMVRLYAPLVSEVRETVALHARLNDLNAGMGHMHLFLREGIVFAISDIPAVPLQQAHIAAALPRFCEIVDSLGDQLEAAFGGRRVESEVMQNATIH